MLSFFLAAVNSRSGSISRENYAHFLSPPNPVVTANLDNRELELEKLSLFFASTLFFRLSQFYLMQSQPR